MSEPAADELLTELGSTLERARALYARAAELAASDLASRPGDTELAASLASYEAKLGHAAAARELLDPIVAAGPTDGYDLYQIATIYEDLGDRADAIRFLAKALHAGYPRDEIDTYPGLDRLRKDPAYTAMVAQLGDAVSRARSSAD